MTLAASRLESNLRQFLLLNGIDVPEARATLNTLIKRLTEENLISKHGAGILDTLKSQRNYMMHTLFDLFSARTADGLMSRDELEDISLLAERAHGLEHELNGFSVIAEKRIAQLQNGSVSPGALLFTP